MQSVVEEVVSPVLQECPLLILVTPLPVTNNKDTGMHLNPPLDLVIIVTYMGLPQNTGDRRSTNELARTTR